jgi:hypothetical protein
MYVARACKKPFINIYVCLIYEYVYILNAKNAIRYIKLLKGTVARQKKNQICQK